MTGEPVTASAAATDRRTRGREARHPRGREGHPAVRRPGRGQRDRLRDPGGPIVSLIGPNGAGKTTFFNVLPGSSTRSSGKIEFNGRRDGRAAASDRAGAGRLGPAVGDRAAARAPALEPRLRLGRWSRRSSSASASSSRRSCSRSSGRSRYVRLPAAARDLPQRPAQRHGRGRHRADVPEHPPVREHDRPRERAGRDALEDGLDARRRVLQHAARPQRGEASTDDARPGPPAARRPARASATSWPRTCRTATSAGWRSRARSPVGAQAAAARRAGRRDEPQRDRRPDAA